MREGFVAAVDADQSTLHGQSAPVLLPPAPIAPKSEWPLTVHLKYKAIRGIKPGEMLSELVFCEPTAADILRYGDPVYFSTSGDARFDEPKMTQMMAALSGVFPPL